MFNYIHVTPTEKLKFALNVETKAWRMHYGKACNNKYRTEMEEIFTFVEELNKRLSRPIKDLDDIRFAMAGLKEIREKEIMIDMNITPIEVSSIAFVFYFNWLDLLKLVVNLKYKTMDSSTTVNHDHL